MSALAVDMQFSRNTLAFELRVIESGKNGSVAVVVRDSNEGWWRLGVHLDQGIELGGILTCTTEVSRIDQTHETGAGVEFVDGAWEATGSFEGANYRMLANGGYMHVEVWA